VGNVACSRLSNGKSARTKPIPLMMMKLRKKSITLRISAPWRVSGTIAVMAG